MLFSRRTDAVYAVLNSLPLSITYIFYSIVRDRGKGPGALFPPRTQFKVSHHKKGKPKRSVHADPRLRCLAIG